MPHLRLWFIYAKEVTFLAIGSNNKKMVSNGNTAFINRNILSKMYLCKHCRRWIDTNIHRMKMNKKEKKINDRCALPVLHIWANAPTDRSVDFRFIRFFFFFWKYLAIATAAVREKRNRKEKKWHATMAASNKDETAVMANCDGDDDAMIQSAYIHDILCHNHWNLCNVCVCVWVCKDWCI